MKKILGLTLASLLSICLVTGGIWAYFSDPEDSSTNILLTGTVDLSPSTTGEGPAGKITVTEGGDQVNGKVVFTKLLPGESGNVTWVLVNTGALPGTLVVESVDNFTENDSNEVESAVSGNNHAGNGDLDIFVGVKLQRGIGTDQPGAAANLTYILGSDISYVPLSGLEAALDSAGTAMGADGENDTVVFYLKWSVAYPLKGAGGDGFFGTADDTQVNYNIIQSDSALVDITFTINQ
jgi:hypothetical protein